MCVAHVVMDAVYVISCVPTVNALINSNIVSGQVLNGLRYFNSKSTELTPELIVVCSFQMLHKMVHPVGSLIANCKKQVFKPDVMELCPFSISTKP